MTAPTLDLTDADLGSLLALDFEPTLPCDHEHHRDSGEPGTAEWRLVKRHASEGSCGWTARVYCDACVRRLYSLGLDKVECSVCHDVGAAAEWWRLLGRL